MESRGMMFCTRGIVLGFALIAATPFAAFAQDNQPAWQPTHPSNDTTADKTINDPKTQGPIQKGFSRPEGCTDEKLLTQQLVAYCMATPDGFFWRWYDFDTYVCMPNGTPTFRRIEYTRQTNAPCNKKGWERTKTHGALYGEDWTVNNTVFDSETLKDPHGGGTDDPPPLGDGARPSGRTAEVLKIPDEKKATEEKTNDKMEIKTITKTEAGAGHSDGKIEKRPRKEIKTTRNKTPRRATPEVSQTRQQQPVDHTPELIGIGIGIGLGGRGTGRSFERGGHLGDK